MPQAIAAAAASWFSGTTVTGIASAAAAGAATAVVYAAAYVAVSAAVVYGTSQLSRSNLPKNSVFADQGRSVMIRDPVSPRRKIYGQILTSGMMYPVGVAGTKNEDFHFAVVYAGHQVDEIGDLYFGNELIPLNVLGDATNRFTGFVHMGPHVGDATQTVDAAFNGAFPGQFTSAHKGVGVAYDAVRLKYSTDLFPSGLPTVKRLIKGARCYDPRDSGQDPNDSGTWLWTQNAALIVADYLHDPIFGKGIAWSRINMTALIAAANVCDEDMVLEDESTEKRYTINGTVTCDQDTDSVLNDLAAAMAGTVVDSGGFWTINAGAYRSPAVTLGDGDLVGAFTVQPRMSRQDTYNGVKGVFISPINEWQLGDFPAVKNDTYKGWDGGIRLWKDVSFGYTISSPTAQRLAKIDLERARQQITFSARYNLKALTLIPGDTVQITRAALGWTNKVFEITSWELQLDPGETGNTLTCNVTFRETAAAVWDWADGEETTDDPAPNTDLPDPNSVPTPSGLTLTSNSTTAITQPDGTHVPRLKVSWNVPNNAMVEQGGKARIEYKKTADSTWLLWSEPPGTVLEDFITDVKGDTNYDVRVQFENALGVRGAYASVTNFTVSKDLTNPGDVTGLSATALVDAIRLDWTNPTDADFAYTEFYQSTSSTPPSSGTAATFKAGNATKKTVTGLTAGTTYYFFARARDKTTNPSNWTSEVHAIPLAISDYVLGVIESADGGNLNFYQTTAPTTGMSTGDLWFDTDDGNKVYRFNGTSWVSVQDTKIPDLESDLGDLEATVTTLASDLTSEVTARAAADDDLGAEYVLKVTAGNRVAGFRITNHGGGGDSSDFVIESDKFQIVNTSGAFNTVPFQVDGSGVYIDEAVIRALDAGKISAGNITVALNLAGGTISTTSGNFTVDSGGNLTATNGVFSGSVKASFLEEGCTIGPVGTGLSAVLDFVHNGGDNWRLDINDSDATFRIFNLNSASRKIELGTGVTNISECRVWGHLYCQTGPTTFSSREFKDDIQPIDYGLEQALRLSSASKRYLLGPMFGDLQGTSDIGLIAEEVAEICPEAVSRSDDGVLGITYHKLIPVLLSGISELNEKLEALAGAKGSK